MTAFTFLLTFIAGTVFGATVMGLCMAAKLGEDDPAEPVGYVDQDGESTPAAPCKHTVTSHGSDFNDRAPGDPICIRCGASVKNDGESTPAQHQWRNAGMKAHHAE